MPWIKIHSEPILIIHSQDISPTDTGEDYLHYGLLVDVGRIRNEVKMWGEGQSVTNCDVTLNNTRMIDGILACVNLFAVPPLGKKAEIYDSDGEFFTGNIVEVKLDNECKLTIRA